MKKLNLFFLSILLTYLAQAQYVQVGTDTYPSHSSVGETPFRTSSHDHRVQYLFYDTELTSIPTDKGISKIAFYIVSANNSFPIHNLKVKLGHTNQTYMNQLVGFEGCNMQEVFSGNYQPTSNSWNEIQFERPFDYDGTSNLVVQICFDNNSSTSNTTVRFTTAGPANHNTVMYTSYNNEVGCDLDYPVHNLFLSRDRPNIRFYNEDFNLSQSNSPTTISTTDESPFGITHSDGRIQYLIPASKMSSLNIIPLKNINSIGFDLASVQNLEQNNLTVKVSETSLSSLSGFVGTSNQVFHGDFVADKIGWNFIPLDQPFQWDGTSNLLIDICYDNTSIGLGSSGLLRGNNEINNMTWSELSNGNAGCANTAGLGSTFIPNLKFSQLEMLGVSQNSESIDQYEKFELTIDMSAQALGNLNKYDPDEVNIYASFVSPSGVEIIQPAFFFQDYSRSYGDMMTVLYEGGPCESNTITVNTNTYNYKGLGLQWEKLTELNSSWKVRFTPQEAGNWTYKVYYELNDPCDQSKTFPLEGSFICNSSNKKGFVRVRDTRYFEYTGSDNPLYLQNGLNYPHPWSEFRQPYTSGAKFYEEMFDIFERNEINFVRIFFDDNGGFSVYGYDFNEQVRYFDHTMNQKDSKRIDIVMDYAEQKGIQVQFCLFRAENLQDVGNAGGSYSGFSLTGSGTVVDHTTPNPCVPGANSEFRNPFYDVATATLGLNPMKFFEHTNSEITRPQKNILRYIVSRWGYSTSVFAWEFFNEVNNIFGDSKWFAPPTAPIPGQNPDNIQLIDEWHGVMINYIKSIDVHNHMVTTSYTGESNWVQPGHNTTPMYGNIPNIMNGIDFISTHAYRYNLMGVPHGLGDLQIRNYEVWYDQLHKNFGKPFSYGESGDAGLYKNNGSKNPNNPQGFGDNVIFGFDRYLFDFHNNMWSAIFTGQPGNEAFWYRWQIEHFKLDITNPTDPFYDGYFRKYKALNKFFSKIEDLDDSFNFDVHEDLDANSDPIRRVFSLSNSDHVYAWIQDSDFRVDKLLTDKTIRFNNKYLFNEYSPISNLPFNVNYHRPNVESGTVTISNSDLSAGGYIVEWIDTETGDVVGSPETAYSNGNKLTLSIPNHMITSAKYGDIALKAKFDCNVQVWNNYRLLDGSNLNASTDVEVDQSGTVFYRTTNDEIHAIWRDGTQLAFSDLYQSVNDAKSELAISPNGPVFYITNSNTIKAIEFSNNVWQQMNLNGASLNNVASDIVCNSLGEVFYRTTNNQIHGLIQNNNVWQHTVLNNSSGTNVAGDLAIAPNGVIFYRTTSNQIRAIEKVGSVWQQKNLNNMANNQDVKGPIVAPSNKKIYYVTTSNDISGIKYNNGGGYWHAVNFNGLSVSDIEGELVSIDKDQLFYKTINNEFATIKNTGSNNWIKDEMNGVANGKVGENVTISTNGTIFYITNNGDEHIEKVYYGSGCDDEILYLRQKNKTSDQSLSSLNDDELMDNSSIELFIVPNPNNGIFRIVGLSKLERIENINIYNINGNEVNIPIHQDDEFIDLRQLTSGLYFINIQSNNKMYNLKLVKN